jgi:crotonobetainyl-CoA:carnitine CoA-transferase CaiB-like acyl-CoA transferase
VATDEPQQALHCRRSEVARLKGSVASPHDRKSPLNALLNPYQTSDNRWILLVAAQRKDWPGFCEANGTPELLEDPRFNDENRIANAAQLVEILDPMFANQPLAYWKQVLDAGRVAWRWIRSTIEAAARLRSKCPDFCRRSCRVSMVLRESANSSIIRSRISR